MKPLFVALCLLSFHASAAALRSMDSAEFIEHPTNRADRFLARLGETTVFLQLYFAEGLPAVDREKARIELETAYYALPDRATALRAGAAALAHTRGALRDAFTVHTRMTPVPGDPDAVYAFVSPATGGDLSALLIRAGHARVGNTGDDSPIGLPQEEMAAILRDLQDAAMLERAGVWAQSDLRLLPRARATFRRLEQKNLPPLNVNSASETELLRLPGVDAALAGRIVRGRPYRSTQDLLDVRGVGEKVLETWRGRVVIE